MLYKCNNCGRGFTKYKKYIENGERWAVCPFCLDSDIEETDYTKNKILKRGINNGLENRSN